MNLHALKSLRPSKTWLALIVALAIGLVAAFAASSFLSNRLADIEAKATGKTVNLVVAKRDLKRGDAINSDSVAVRAIPLDYAHSGAVLPEQFGSIEGEVIASDLKAGELLLWGLMEGKKAPTFSTRIEAGRRAITVAVDEINSISGLLEPGDLIDILVTVDQQGRKATLPLLQGVRVMATGQRSQDDPKSGERRLYSTVTLDTDPQQAENLVVAREAGRLTALLRNPQDVTPSKGSQGDFASMLNRNGPLSAVKTMAKVPIPVVPVLYGGTGGRIPPEGLYLGQYASPASLNQQMMANSAAAALAMERNAAVGAGEAVKEVIKEAVREVARTDPAPARPTVPVLLGGRAP